jgi:hypothetical protein
VEAAKYRCRMDAAVTHESERLDVPRVLGKGGKDVIRRCVAALRGLLAQVTRLFDSIPGRSSCAPRVPVDRPGDSLAN